jgi:diadenosine tetraphosphate (Ap4A) HIT family hydrolase
MTPEFPDKPNCTFCRIVEAGDELIAEGDLAVAFWDSYPLNPGHALIIPRRHDPDFFNLSADEQAALFSLLPEVREACSARGQADGFNIGINVGLAAGQTIGHVHLHLIPRVVGDSDPLGDGSLDPRGGVRWVVPDRADYWND